MPEEDTLFTDEELQDISTAAALAAAGCSAVSAAAAPTCWAVAGGAISALYTADWIWDNLVPDAVKSFIYDHVAAEGVFDWQTLYDPIYKFCVESHAKAVLSVDAAWAEMHGQPPGPSPAGAFLNDWVNRNGWRKAVEVDFKVDGKMRWMKLRPDLGPWVIEWGPSMPKRADTGGKEAFAKTIVNILTAHRLSVLQRAVQETLVFTALSLTGTAWKVYAGPVREAVWVHGSSVTPERRGDLSAAQVFGSGARYHAKPGQRAWFHVQVPTPALIDDIRPVCTKIFLMFQTSGARMEALHVYDGAHRVAQFDDLAFDGDHHIGFDAANARLLFPCPTIQSGLSLSSLIHFGPGVASGQSTDPWVHFTTAGADFNRSA
ncbi:DUF6623 family protein [Thetidibacter halocola]|uniref:Uncharacterized protein n=1 Tax=Thetidibacter halocola TaxID=2827239 RepID=A0A8J8B5E3_9RHOB|nr:DUF6623 family protein [Thetidibacter halocola]MBS0122851.1 hypothetical protein [Thetidibacter halocola]